jgi:hypothetical protein
MRHPRLWNIRRPNAMRQIDVLDRQMLGVRPLRLGHRHDRCQVISSFSYLRKLAIHCNTCLKALTSGFVLFFLF